MGVGAIILFFLIPYPPHSLKYRILEGVGGNFKKCDTGYLYLTSFTTQAWGGGGREVEGADNMRSK